MARRRRLSRSLALAATFVVTGVVTVVLAADGVLHVGDTSFGASEVQQRLERVPPYQLKTLGDSPEAIKREFVNQLARVALLAQGAQAAGLHERPDVRDRIRSVYVSALLERLRIEAEEAGEVSDDEVRAYYDANKARFESQQRVKVWQIVVDSPDKVDKVYAALKTDAYVKDPVGEWDRLAREMSIDKTTAMRKGNIGFVQPDGSTAHRDVRVPKEVYAAAMSVGDGEVFGKPLKVGDYFVIVQRRSAIQTPERTLEAEAKTIWGLLSKRKVGERRKALLLELKDRWVKEKNDRMVDALEVTPVGELNATPRPGTLPRGPRRPKGSHKPSGNPLR
jgi:peptidyl-prolyl cis-trans isomerase C